MSDFEIKDMDELLNAYIDNELSKRQQQEIQRLISHDAAVAKRFNELQKCKLLVSSMPQARAPENTLESIRSSLERRVLLNEYDSKTAVSAMGFAQLFARKFVSIAAMLILVIFLGAIVFVIIKPTATKQVIVAKTDFSKAQARAIEVKAKNDSAQQSAKVAKSEPAKPVVEPIPTRMELELKTDQYMAVTSFVYRAVILDNGLLDSANIDRQQNKTIYSFVCSRARMNNVLDDLAGVWSKFKTAKFILGNSNSGAVVNNINPEQVMQILTQRNWPDQVKLAKDFDIMNKITEANPAADPIAALDSANVEISKPVLTSGEKKAAPKDPVGVEKINLVISVFGI